MRSTPPSALLIRPAEQDDRFLCSLLKNQGWNFHAQPSFAAASTMIAVALIDRHLADANWQKLLEQIGRVLTRLHLTIFSLHLGERAPPRGI
jgi:hypothetical protein